MQGNMLLKLLLCIFVSASFAAAWPSLRGTGRQGLQKLQGEEDASWRAMFNDFDRNHDGRLGPGEIVRTGHTLGRRSAAKLMDMVAEDGSIDFDQFKNVLSSGNLASSNPSAGFDGDAAQDPMGALISTLNDAPTADLSAVSETVKDMGETAVAQTVEDVDEEQQLVDKGETAAIEDAADANPKLTREQRSAIDRAEGELDRHG